MRRCFRFRLGSLALVCSSFFGTILLRAAVTSCATTTSHQPHNNVASVENPNVQMRLTLLQDPLNRVPSCQHTFSHMEVINLHASDSITITSIQTTPEETFLTRHDPQKQQPTDGGEEKEQDIFASASSSSSTSWDQRSIPQQIHTARIPPFNISNGFVIGPGETAIVPVTYLPRYPCTLGTADGSGGNELEDYYAQQAPYQIAFSSTFDPDDENFSLAQPPPPKLTKLISGTAKADWEQLLRDMPPQERSNWLQQQQQQQQRKQQGISIDQPDAYQEASGSTTTNTDGAIPGTSDEDIFELRTTILVQTTRGTVQLPVRASSKRQNAYGLPDVIYFDEEEEMDSSRASSSQENVSPQPYSTTASKPTPGVLWLDTDMAPAASTGGDGSGTDHQEADDEEEGEDEISLTTSRDCYNLFMTNPSTDEEMRIEEVFLSSPDLTNLQVQGQLRAPSSSIRHWWNLSPGQKKKGYKPKAEGLDPLIIGPGEQSYVATVCTSGSSGISTSSDGEDWLNNAVDPLDRPFFTRDDGLPSLAARSAKAAARAARLATEADHSLGFIYIQTEARQTFFVALERLRKQCKSGSPPLDSGRHDKANQLSPQSAPTAEYKQQAHRRTSYHNSLYQAEMQSTAELATKSEKASATIVPASPLVSSVLKSVPHRLDFSLLSSSSATVTSYLGVYNPKDYPIKIMRSGVAVEVEDEVDSSQPNPEELGLHMSVKIQNSILQPKGVTEKALMITCSIRWDRFRAHNLESLFFHGNAILRATSHVHFNYNQWIRNLVNTNSKKQQGKILITNDYANEPNPGENTKQTEFVLEIPLSVSMVQGKIGIMIHRTSHPFPHLWAVQSWQEGLGSVSSIFYPQRAFDIRAEIDTGDGPQSEPIFGRGGIDHRLRIFANVHVPSRVANVGDYQPQSLQVASASIGAEQTSEEPNDPDQDEDICGRFNVTILAPPKDEFPFEGFSDVGLLNLKYRFPRSKRADSDEEADELPDEDNSPAYPKYCLLSFTTDPFTEHHQIPLIIYPGQTEITPTQSLMLAKRNRRGKSKENNKKKSGSKSTDKSLLEDSLTAMSHTVVGFDHLLEWFQTSRIGSSLKSFLEQASADQRDWGWTRRSDDNKTLLKYLSSLSRKSLNLRTANLRPILLKVGAIRHGTVETSSFYMTNHNPIPLLVSVDVGEVEGMSISLARVPTRGQGDGHNILDHFPKIRTAAMGGPYQHLVQSGEHEGHPLEGLRKFLKTSDTAQQFLRRFRYRDAISVSRSAVDRQPLLGTLYKKYAFGEFHRDPLPLRLGKDGWSQCKHHRKNSTKKQKFVGPYYRSPELENDEEDPDDSAQAIKSGTGPLMISDDSKPPRPLRVCWEKDGEPSEYPSDGTYTIVPPGAVARFDLKLHAPPKSMLQDDITRFLSTGLSLSTDHGETLPIFVTFEALLGELQLLASNEGGVTIQDPTVMQVPANLFHDPRAREVGQSLKQDRSVPLRVQSSFSRDVRLVSVTSCNPWFHAQLDDSEGARPVLPKRDPLGSHSGVDIGVVMSTIGCDGGNEPIATLDFPSFYQCVLNWLSNRSELQPRGCGMTSIEKEHAVEGDEGSPVHLTEHGGVKRAVKAFEKALLVSSFAFGGNGKLDSKPNARRLAGDGFVAPMVLDVFAEAWDAWRVVADFGFRKLSSTLKATIEYESAGGRKGNSADVQNLTVSMRDTIVESVLMAPKLFDPKSANASDDVSFATLGNDDAPSVIEFNPTLVADSSSLTIPLRNPTAVPIRVRLAAAYPHEDKSGAEKDTLKSKFSVDEEVRVSFKETDAAPFVQRKKINTTTQHYHAGVMAEQLWWDGAGGYFLADEYGDLIRSHHNVRIMAGAGAHVSLVNPSLHSNLAVLVGCGIRCGVRDEKNVPSHMQGGNESSKLTSPFGASAAAGVTLSGRTRSSMAQVNVRSTEEPLFSAGAATPGKSGGPAAFALPFSALEEIVIPPFGEVEVGPIMFRPPGRHSVHGCQAAAESGAMRTPSSEKSRACESNVYQSMLYVENSLTGLERIRLRGKALWERVVFLDPPPVDKLLGDEFGSIELRHSRPTLMFPGGKATGPTTLEQQRHSPISTVSGSVIKEVLVHNEGDTIVDFESVYLSDSARLHSKHSTSNEIRRLDDVCAYKQFRLLNCFDDESGNEDQALQSVTKGFVLQPGQNISLYVEHFPDCSRPRDFIALNIERRRKSRTPSNRRGLHLKGKDQSSSFRHRKLELLIGYDMSDEDYNKCSPIQRWGLSISHLHKEARCIAEKRCRDNWFSRFNHRMLWLGWTLLALILTSLMLVATFTTIYSGYLFRRKSSDFFSAGLGLLRRKTVDNGSADKAQTSGRGNWSAAFRCLARADPTSSDLQTLGREQVRHVVLGRYRSMGILSPQCLSSNGVFNRERGGVASGGSPSRQTGGREGNMGSGDRARTLSDAMFRNYSAYHDNHLRSSLPCGLSWRAALSRGIAFPNVSVELGVALMTSELLVRRAAGEKNEQPFAGSSLHYQEQSQQSTDGSEQSDGVSEGHDTDDGDDSQLQESYVSELSEDPSPETTDDTSDVLAPSADRTNYADSNSEANDANTEEEPLLERPEIDTTDEPIDDTVLTKAEDAEDKDKNLKSANGAKAEREKPAAKGVKEPKKDAPKSGRKKERAVSPQPQKKKEKPQDAKRERRGRQKGRGTSPVKSENAEPVVSNPQPKQSQGKDARAKANENKTPRQTKGKTGTEKGKATLEKGKPQAEKGKPGGKANPREREKKNANSTDSKAGKGAEGDDKGNRRRGNKGDTQERAKKNTKDGNGKSMPNEKKAKNASSKQVKKGRTGKTSAATPTKTRNQDSASVRAKEAGELETPTPTPVLRPPPGLAPPPGFGDRPAAPQTGSVARSAYDAPLLPPSAFLSDTSILGSTSSAVLGTPSRPLGESTFGSLSPSILSGDPTPLTGVGNGTPLRGTSSLSASTHAGEGLLGSVANTPMDRSLGGTLPAPPTSAGFDVMDFLDSILNDGNPAPPELSPQRGGQQSPFLSGGAQGAVLASTPVQPLASTPVLSLSSDPWATERQSRATAYGISFDDGEGGGTKGGLTSPSLQPLNEGSEVTISSIPLLNTAAILSAVDRQDDDDDDEDNGTSFYAGLLGMNADDEDESRRD